MMNEIMNPINIPPINPILKKDPIKPHTPINMNVSAVNKIIIFNFENI